MLKRSDLWADQVEAIDRLLDFALGRVSSNFMLLEGAAGTGKTSSARVFLEELPEHLRAKTVVCAPTNKAVKVARQLAGTLVPTTTIYKLLRLIPKENGEVKEISRISGAEDALENIDLVYLDEGSMVGQMDGPSDPRGLRYHIERAMIDHGIKFIVAGDRYQLPPPGELDSWVFREAERLNQVARLTEVKRHDNQILTLATHIREVIDGKCRLKLKDDFDDAGGVEVFSKRRGFENFIVETWQKSDGQAEDANRVLAWRNATSQSYNELIRETIYGRVKSRESLFQEGERIVVCNPVKSLQDDNETLMHTDEEGIVRKISVVRHPKFNEVECYALAIERDDNQGICGVLTPTENGKLAQRRIEKNLSAAAAEDRRRWGAFWAFKDYMNDVRPCHALTVHRSQGSTFRQVFVDVDDLMLNSRDEEALRCLYVAATRPSVRLNLKYGY